jgi:hypothetical protein
LNLNQQRTTPGGHLFYTFGNIEFVKVPRQILMGSSDKDKHADDDETAIRR